jgi:hypothetical protein
MKKEQLEEYCDAEYESIDAVLTEIASLLVPGKAHYSTPELAALATFVHNCYNGFENVLKRILLYRSVTIADSAAWHKDLLEKAVAMGIIGEDLRDGLSAYMSFRHFFVHAYSFTLKWTELKPLVEGIAATAADFKTTTSRYIEALRAQI